MSDFESLLLVDTERPIRCVERDADQFADQIVQWRAAGLFVRVVRGRKMTRFEDLMNEFAAALQFPYYFGENWAAFQECLEDSDWMDPDVAIVIAVTDAADVLSHEPDADLAVLIDSFLRAAGAYGQPVAEGEWWDRPAIPFHVVLQDVGAWEIRLSRWNALGAKLAALRE